MKGETVRSLWEFATSVVSVDFGREGAHRMRMSCLKATAEALRWAILAETHFSVSCAANGQDEVAGLSQQDERQARACYESHLVALARWGWGGSGHCLSDFCLEKVET